MSLMKTLAKVAIGVAVAKGIGTVMQNRASAGTGASGAGRGDSFGGSHSPRGGGLEDRMGELLGKKARPGGQGGGLGDLLDQLGGARPAPGQAPGGASLEDMLGGLTGRGTGQGGKGGLGDLLKGGGADGGLGGLLGGLLGGAAGGAGGGSFGDLLNQSLQTGGEPDVAPSAAQEAGAALMLRAMIQAAKSDGKIDAAEREKLLQHLGDASDAEKAFVNRELAQPVDARGLAGQVPRGMEQQVYMMSLMGIDLDNRTEAQYLHDLATAMGISQGDVNSVHDSLGVPRIYS